jgi:putative membrane protein
VIAHTAPAAHLLGVLAALVLGAGYAWCWRRTGRRDPFRLAGWAAGLLAGLLVTTPSVEAWAARSFTAHMVQHLVLVVVVAPLLAVARPLATGLAAVPIARHRRPRSADLSAAAAAGATTLTFVAVHFSGWYDAALRAQWVHEAEHLAFVVTATWLWGAVLAPAHRRGPVRVLAVFATITGMSLVGMVLVASSEPISRQHVAQLGPQAALDDQRAGATLMWVAGMAVTLPLLLAAVWRWASAEERIAAARDMQRAPRSSGRTAVARAGVTAATSRPTDGGGCADQ